MGNVRESFTLTRNKDYLKNVCELKIFPVKEAKHFMASFCLIRGVRKCEKLIHFPKKKNQGKIFKVIKKVLGNVRVLKSNTAICPACLCACQENTPHSS